MVIGVCVCAARLNIFFAASPVFILSLHVYDVFDSIGIDSGWVRVAVYENVFVWRSV